ncbi:MAG: hypothetical protein PVS2B2_13870 [Candidatus Acidiferrum sp.]
MDAVDGADIDAGGVLSADARFGDYVSHSKSPLHKAATGRETAGTNCKRQYSCQGYGQHLEIVRVDGEILNLLADG